MSLHCPLAWLRLASIAAQNIDSAVEYTPLVNDQIYTSSASTSLPIASKRPTYPYPFLNRQPDPFCFPLSTEHNRQERFSAFHQLNIHCVSTTDRASKKCKRRFPTATIQACLEILSKCILQEPVPDIPRPDQGYVHDLFRSLITQTRF